MSGEVLERELKIGIQDAAAFDALMKVAGGQRDDPLRQLNHFFDTASGALRSRKIGFRIREEGQDWILTIKGPTKPNPTSHLAERVELESNLEPALARAVIEAGRPAVELLDQLDLSAPEARDLSSEVRVLCAAEPLNEIGSFENVRTRVRTRLAGIEIVLELDRTRFTADDIRFEVELELQPGQPEEGLTEALLGLFARAGIEPQPTAGKLTTFQEILDSRR
jgi:inorganic triphosphatase YgiF